MRPKIRTRYDVAKEGPLPIKCPHCGEQNSFNGLNDRRTEVWCQRCGKRIPLTHETKMPAAFDYDRRTFGPPT